MAYSVDDIESIFAWTTTNYTADDGTQDIDNTICMTNGTVGEDCDEVKEGTIVLRIVIPFPPSAIEALSARFYLNSIMTAGPNVIMPYTDVNSVSNTNEVAQTYDTAGQWYNHVTDSSFRGELGDIGGGKSAIRFAANTGVAKSKIGEVNLDVTVTQEFIPGVTKDDGGTILPSGEVALFRVTSEGPPHTYEFVDSLVSSSSGTYNFSIPLNSNLHMLYGEKDDSPHIFDASDNVILSSGV